MNPEIRSSSWLARISGVLGVLAILAVPVVAQADEMPARGESTRAWMELQKAQKPKENERISGEQAQLIWDRHMKSFGKDVPDSLRDDSDISSGSR